MGADDIFYVIIVVGYLIYSLIKQKNKPQPPVPQEEELEYEQMQEMQKRIVLSRRERPPITNQEMDTLGRNIESQEDNLEQINDNTTSIEYIDDEKFHQTLIKEAEEDLRKQAAISTRIGNDEGIDFNLRAAIIYSEIIQPKYF